MTNRSSRAGLAFPVGKLTRHMRSGIHSAKRMQGCLPVRLAAGLEFFAMQAMKDAAVNASKQAAQSKSVPKPGGVTVVKVAHVHKVINSSQALRRLLRRPEPPRPFTGELVITSADLKSASKEAATARAEAEKKRVKA